MIGHIVHINKEFSPAELARGIYIVITEANRIPPHIGMMIDGKFSSLTVKGNETDVPAGVLVKNIMLRKIPSLFIRIADHPVFSRAYLHELLVSCVTEFRRVEAGGPTCLVPVKNFFKEAYHICPDEIHYLFHLLPTLEENGLISGTAAFHIAGNKFELPFYSADEINERIAKVRMEYNT